MREQFSLPQIILAGLVVLVALMSVYATGQRSTDKKPNVVVIDVDTLRADRLGIYGHTRNTSPVIDRFGRQGIAFEQAISPATWTRPVAASLLTSLYPQVHGFTEVGDRIPRTLLTLPEVLRAQGYRTGAFVGSEQNAGELAPGQGFEQGFQTYRAPGYSFSKTFPEAVGWINNTESPFFAFIHGADVHEPYGSPGKAYLSRFAPNYSGIVKKYLPVSLDPPHNFLGSIRKKNGSFVVELENGTVPLNEQDMDYIRAAYDADIRWFDTRFSEFLDALRTMDKYANTVIILVGDNGENLADHPMPKWNRSQWFGHSSTYDHTIRVPLIMRVPGRSHRRIEKQVELIDIMPTIIDLSGASLNATLAQQLQGVSLTPFFRGTIPQQLGKYAFSATPPTVRTTTWKYMRWVHGRPPALYNLQKDPQEEHNVLRNHTLLVKRLKTALQNWRLRNTKRKQQMFSGP